MRHETITYTCDGCGETISLFDVKATVQLVMDMPCHHYCEACWSKMRAAVAGKAAKEKKTLVEECCSTPEGAKAFAEARKEYEAETAAEETP